MLVNIFGAWINPDNVTHLEEVTMPNDTVITFIRFNGTVYFEDGEQDSSAVFVSECEDMVAREINKQIRENK